MDWAPLHPQGVAPTIRPFFHARHVEAPIFAGTTHLDFSHPDAHRPARKAGTLHLGFLQP